MTAAIDLEDIRSYRGAMASRGQQAAAVLPAPRVRIDFSLTAAPGGLRPAPSAPRPVQYLSPEEVRQWGGRLAPPSAVPLARGGEAVGGGASPRPVQYLSPEEVRQWGGEPRSAPCSTCRPRR